MSYESGDLREGTAPPAESRLTGFLRSAVNVRAEEVRALLWSFAYFFCLLCGYFILRPLREEMAIQSGLSNLRWLFTATFFTMLLVVPLYGKIVARFPRRRFIPLVYYFFILNVFIFYFLLLTGTGLKFVTGSYFVWLGVFNLFVVSVFWSFMADLFQNEQGKRLFGFIAAGGTSGAVVGPMVVIFLVDWIGTVHLFLAAAVFLEGAVLCFRQLDRVPNVKKGSETQPLKSLDQEEIIGGGILSGAIRVFRSPYFIGICLYIFLYTTTSTFLYFFELQIVEENFSSKGQRVQAFSWINLLKNTLTLGMQFFVTGRFMKRFGTASALAVLPLALALAFSGLAVAPILPVLFLAIVLRNSSNFAISRPAREVLFTVVGREDKYKSKNFIDTVVYRGGDAVAGWVYAGLGAVGLGLSGIAIVAVPIALAWAGLAVFLGKKQEKLSSENVG